jgi:hypothetical protein
MIKLCFTLSGNVLTASLLYHVIFFQWHVYQKWNQRLFNEMYQAYQDGRSDRNPADGWYNGELEFLDHYIIPLAQKLKDCGAFDVSGDEYLNYARHNRSEWAVKGRSNVERYMDEFQQRNYC